MGVVDLTRAPSSGGDAPRQFELRGNLRQGSPGLLTKEGKKPSPFVGLGFKGERIPLKELISQANEAFKNYLRLQGEGHFAEAAKELTRLQEALQQLAKHLNKKARVLSFGSRKPLVSTSLVLVHPDSSLGRMGLFTSKAHFCSENEDQ
jgi:hypothetical protein